VSGDALIALVGVGFGAVVTYLARLFLELRRERAETGQDFDSSGATLRTLAGQ
jgi:hypothetical protein